jgi:hypothetical protein
MQRIEHGTRHVPVEVMGLEVEGVGVRQQLGQAFRDLLAVLVGNTDIHAHLILLCHGKYTPFW